MNLGLGSRYVVLPNSHRHLPMFPKLSMRDRLSHIYRHCTCILGGSSKIYVKIDPFFKTDTSAFKLHMEVAMYVPKKNYLPDFENPVRFSNCGQKTEKKI